LKTLAGYALAYAKLGWSVIPIQTKGKRSKVKWEKFQKERPTEDQIKGWWKKWPKANIGIITGSISDIIVMDIDSQKGREEYIAAFSELHNTISQTSGKPGAIHLLFKHPQDKEYANMAGIYKDVDVRADGGYIVAAPSIHENGTQYKWNIDPTEMGLDDLMDLPGDVKSKLTTNNSDGEAVSKNPEGWVQEALMGVPEGKRNDTCAKLAGYFLRAFHGDIEQTKIVLETWNERNEPPLDWKRVVRTIKSVADREGREELGKTVGEKIEKIQILKYPPPDNTRRYRVFLSNNSHNESVEMTTNELVTFSQFKIKFCELANRIPRPVKQTTWERMVNRALAEAEIIQLTTDETLTGLIIRLINSEVYSDGLRTDIEWIIGNRIVVSQDIIYLRMDTLLNMVATEREKITRKDIGQILRSLGFRNEKRTVKGLSIRTWYRPLDNFWRETYSG